MSEKELNSDDKNKKMNNPENKSVENKPIEENTEIDLRELQIKLEKMHGYLMRAQGRIKKNENELKKLREVQLERESKKRGVSVVTHSKVKKKKRR